MGIERYNNLFHPDTKKDVLAGGNGTNMNNSWECIVIGGGIAGIQAAIQMGRSQINCLVLDSKEAGRSNLCKDYRNIIGWPEGVSGEELRQKGKQQASETGVQFVTAHVKEITKNNETFFVKIENETHQTKTLLLATGVTDRIPDIPNLRECLGSTIYICTDCDGYEAINKKIIVMGAGDAGASLALSLLHWTDDITYINHEKIQVSDDILSKLNEHQIQYVEEEIDSVTKESEDFFTGVHLKNGEVLKADRAFIGFGGNQVHTELAKQIGIHIENNRHIKVDARTKETNVKNVWAAGDIVSHSEQATIAMGEATQAAIWINKRIMEYKRNGEL